MYNMQERVRGARNFVEGMKQISEEDEKLFTSSLNICPAVDIGGGGGNASPSLRSTTPFKDDVTVILLHGVSFMVERYHPGEL
jgi:hypothetical protein